MKRTFAARFGVALLAAMSVIAMGATVGSATAVAAKPKAGGQVTQGGFTLTTLDPGAPGYSTGAIAIGHAIYGALFDASPDSTKLLPDLATAYSYNAKLTALTLTLRHGVKFQDGTPFNASAVAYNLNRLKTNTDTVNQYFNIVSSVTTSGNYSVTMHFTQPDSTMITVLGTTPAALMVSPTALQSQGANQFGLTPVGAGPYKVTSYTPGQSLTMVRDPGSYYDMKTVYLSQLNFLNTGTDTQTEFDDVASNSIQSLAQLGAAVLPSVLQQAKTTANVSTVKGPNDVFYFLAINTFVAPFNNQQAREALDYCMDRDGIAKFVYQGFDSPAYVLAGTSEYPYPAGGWKAEEKGFPYPLNLSKGTQLVHSIAGGVSFNIQDAGGVPGTLATALAQDWTQCGMNVTITTTPQGTLLEKETEGQYQVAVAGGGGNLNPGLFITYEIPSAAPDSHGFNLPTVTNLIDATGYTTNEAALISIWRRVWAAEDNAAVAIPVVSSSNYYFDAKCLRGEIGIFAGVDFNHAYYACTP